MTSRTSSRQFREDIVGKTISGVIARPGCNGEPPVVLMLRFDDGSVVEFVSPRSDRLLRQATRAARADHRKPHQARTGAEAAGQLSLEGLMSGLGHQDSLSGRA